ncbi:MAG: histidinol phosphatase [Propionibacterium sp.]|nr:MAG: histidinol phosphatase [Propionibacterium sp.]
MSGTDLAWEVSGKTIIEDISVEIPEHKITMIVGLNGSGKTTLLHLLAGLRKPSRGKVMLGERNLGNIPRKERAKRIALLEQVPRANVDLPVIDVVALGRIPHRGKWSRDHNDQAIFKAMETTGITEMADRQWSTLSGGEKQRVQLARALAQEPEILLLDEPTNHLDLRHQIGLLQQVHNLGLTVVAVVHDLDLAAAFGDYLIVLYQGHLASTGAIKDGLTTDMVSKYFYVRSNITDDDRLRFSWEGLVGHHPDSGSVDAARR